jgi:hypothetical protein
MSARREYSGAELKIVFAKIRAAWAFAAAPQNTHRAILRPLESNESKEEISVQASCVLDVKLSLAKYCPVILASFK